MTETFLAIITAHLLGDFVLQTGWMVARKKKFPVLFLHAAIVTLVSALLLGGWHWPILSAIFFLHLTIDAIKVNLTDDSWPPFIIDQCAHFLTLAGLAVLFADAAAGGLYPALFGEELLNWYFASLSLLAGVILIVPAGGILIGKLTSPFMAKLNDAELAGVRKGRRDLGWLERSLVMLLLLIKQPTGIIFLLIAKSVLGFGKIKDRGRRKVARYIIIGTTLSFGWALLVSVITQQSIQQWLPRKHAEVPALEVLIKERP
ncbi:MAG: DUF3307 domain-containing protein [Desulfurivibrionaceae bacterium]|nr:DUF3307 domain-containing protein [Desulfobulbales bacterium]MDT8335740.1 DUF3307 domain-containing protein [Desulfurivibrionaceae bacterium]